MVDESKLRQYLLKNLSDKETETIDAEIFENEELESALVFAEEDLIEDYIDDTLSPAERKLFDTNFLISKRRRENLVFLAQLKTEIAGIASEETEKPLSISERLAKIFRPKFPQIVVFASVAIVFAVFAWWFIGSGGQTSKIAALNKNDLSNLSEYQNLSNLSLKTDVLRSNNAGKTLQKDLLSEKVLVRLDLRETVDSIPRLEIYRNENLIETLKDVRVYKTPNGAELRLLFPASLLEKGVYRLEFMIENRKTGCKFSVQ